MKSALSRLIKVAAVISGLALGSGSASAASPACTGEFRNFVTDVCWSCVFPIKLFGSLRLGGNDQEDVDSIGTKLACNCNLDIGAPISFWEPSRLIDVTRSPYCMVNLGGTEPSISHNKYQLGGVVGRQSQGSGNGAGVQVGMEESFWHVHWYIQPLMGVLGVVTDTSCLENKGFDLAYLSEIDPTHDDIELENLLTPDAFLFGNMFAQAACAADCVAATAGFPMSSLYWCGGCNGPLFPLSATVKAHVGYPQATSLMAQRITAKLHRAGTQWSGAGSDGMCGSYPKIQMDKSEYKYTMINPVSQTEKINGRCCQPFGRTTALFGANKTIPGKENYGYMLYRKRDCCQKVY